MKYILTALLFLSSAASAQEFNLDSVNWAKLSEKMSAQPDERIPAPAHKPLREWTVMLYMNGKSNVEQFALEDVNELEAAGSSDQVAVIAEVGRAGDQACDETAGGSWKGARIYEIKKDTDTAHVTSPVLASIPEIDMGDYHKVSEFVQWAKKNYPAKKYALIIWDHGWGWLDPKRASTCKENELTRSISHDFTTGNYIKTEEIRPMMQAAGKVDFFASMACFMQMAEIAYELREYTSVVVGSEEVIQLPSFDFTAFLNLVNAKPQSGAEDLGVYLVDTFKALYSRPDMLDMLAQTKYGVQLSALRMSKFPAFVKKLENWARAAQKLNDTAAIAKAKHDVLRMEIGDEGTDPAKLIAFYGDLGNFIELYNNDLAPTPESANVKALGEELLSFIDKELVIRNTGFSKDRMGKDYSITRGVSIDIPGQPGTLVEMENKYSDLDFVKYTYWGEFVKYLDSVK